MSQNQNSDDLPAARSPANKGKTYRPDTLTTDEMARLLRAPSSRAPTGIRNRALLVVLYRAGLRIAEALALRPKDLDHVKGAVHVVRGKGGKPRTVIMDFEAFTAIQRWLDVRTKLGVDGRSALFCTVSKGKRLKAGEPLYPEYCRALMKRLAVRAGITRRVHPHMLRHTMANELRKERIDIGVISTQLGHSSLHTTSLYLKHIEDEEVIEAIHARPSWGG